MASILVSTKTSEMYSAMNNATYSNFLPNAVIVLGVVFSAKNLLMLYLLNKEKSGESRYEKKAKLSLVLSFIFMGMGILIAITSVIDPLYNTTALP